MSATLITCSGTSRRQKMALIRGVSLLCVSALILGLMCVTSLVRAPHATAAASRSDSAAAELLVRKLNAERAKRGLSQLVVSPGLSTVAQRWSEYQRSKDQMSHNPRTKYQIPKGWSRWGENVAWASGYASNASAIHVGWMESPPHRANMLQPQYTHIGIGFASSPDGTAYATQVFGTYPPAARTKASALSSTRGAAKGGAVITIRGRNLGKVTKVVFGSRTAKIVSRKSTRIKVRVPSHRVGKVRVRVRDSIGWSANTSRVSYTYIR